MAPLTNNETFEATITTFLEKLRAIVKNTHASTAIVGASIIDEALQTAILSKMRPLSKNLQKELFDGYGPLSSLSSRTDIAVAFSVISHHIHDDINTIRKIRNRFAHSKKILHFNEPEITDLCKKLSTWNAQKTNLQEVYMESLRTIASYLEESAKQKQPSDGNIK